MCTIWPTDDLIFTPTENNEQKQIFDENQFNDPGMFQKNGKHGTREKLSP